MTAVVEQVMSSFVKTDATVRGEGAIIVQVTIFGIVVLFASCRSC